LSYGATIALIESSKFHASRLAYGRNDLEIGCGLPSSQASLLALAWLFSLWLRQLGSA
jgi:hypothetical protein